MAISPQSALTRLGFKDLDKHNPRHGLACEYLKEKMAPFVGNYLADFYTQIAENQSNKILEDWRKYIAVEGNQFLSLNSKLQSESVQNALKNHFKRHQANEADSMRFEVPSQCAQLSSIIKGPSSGTKGFLDVCFSGRITSYICDPEGLCYTHNGQELFLAPTRYSIEYFKVSFKFCIWGEVKIEPITPELLLQQIEYYTENLKENDMIWVLADFDISDFKRMSQDQFPQLKCFQLGSAFDEWCKKQKRFDVPEL
jgi:hypothetical protein